MRLFENLPKNSVSVERAKVSTTKYDNPDIAPNTVINSLLQNFKNTRIRIIGIMSCITALVALNHPTRTGVKQNGGLIMYKVSTLSLPITVIFPMIKMIRHRLYFHRVHVWFWMFRMFRHVIKPTQLYGKTTWWTHQHYDMKSDGKNLPPLILTVNKIVVFTVYSLAGLITLRTTTRSGSWYNKHCRG